MAFQPSEGYDRLLQARPPGRQAFEAPPATVQTPPPFVEQRTMEPDRFNDWGSRYTTTAMGLEFAPPLEPPPVEGEVV